MRREERLKQILLHEKEIIDALLAELDEKGEIDEGCLGYLFHLDRFYHGIEYQIHKLRRTIEKFENMGIICPFLGESPDRNVLDILTGPSMRHEGLKEIRDFTRDAKKLIIIDPYIYGGETATSQKYIEEFSKSSRLGSIKKLHIIYSSKHGNNKTIKNGIKKTAKDSGCTVSDVDDSSIHDRVWIADRKRAIVVGTSLGGLGNRLCFILSLPNNDLRNLLEYLDEKNLSRKL